MSINYIGAEEINRRKTVSDELNDTEELTFPNSEVKKKSNNKALKIDDRKHVLSIKALECSDDVSELEKMLDEL